MTTSAICDRRICSRNSGRAAWIPISPGDRYMSEKLKEIGFPTWRDNATAPCHTLMPATNKLVIQYPPGTGFVLALFPSGFQVIPLYVLASVVAVGFALVAITYASTVFSLMLVAAFGDAVIYLMINPTKASYSMAPTMIVCALAGFLTAKLLVGAARQQLVLIILIGLLIGLAVNFRLANLFLASGYGSAFASHSCFRETAETLLRAFAFAICVRDRSRADSAREYDQCGKPLLDNIRRRRCDAARAEFKRAMVLFRGMCNSSCSSLPVAWTALIWRRRHRSGMITGCGRCCGKSGGEPDFLHDPSDLHALLYNSSRDAFALDSAVRTSDASSGSRGRRSSPARR